MMFERAIIFIFLSLAFLGCKEETVLPKPKAQLRLEYPNAKYTSLDTKNFRFSMNEIAKVKIENENTLTLDYPILKGSIFLTYKKVDSNLERLIIDAQKLSFEHASMAEGILPQDFFNDQDKVYGVYSEVVGDAASQAQFFVTDSTEHFVTGSIYFYARPNYDSIFPAATYLQNDIRRIMETLRWKK